MSGHEADALEILQALSEAGLWTPGQRAPATERLSGGVSCDVFKVELASGPVCVKRALPRLRVAAEWLAPVERAHNEVAWLTTVETIGGPIVPHVVAEDRARHLFVMSWFEPAEAPNWKAQLAAGEVDPAFARAVGAALARVHAATADDAQVAQRFPDDSLFYALRIEPFLLHPRAAHPDLAPRLTALAQSTFARRRALVHGDVSPKNILVSPAGPVFLDAECAWFGDPAFDLAFCATHLLLKTVWRPQFAPAYLASFDALLAGYFAAPPGWEAGAELDRRTAALLAALLLARVDGKSPAEYLTSEADRERVRAAARTMILQDRLDLAGARALWTAGRA